MADFPVDLSHVRRQFKAAQFPTKRFTSMSGAGTTRLYGSKGFDATLDLQFLVDDEHAHQNHRQLGGTVMGRISLLSLPDACGCQQ